MNMKITKIVALLLAIVCAFNLLVACDKGGEDNNGNNDNNINQPTYTDYSVKVVDGIGNPVSNVMVKFTYPDGTTKTRVTENDGTAQLKNVLADEYKVTIEQGFSDIIIEKSEYVLTADSRELEVIVRDSKITFEIYGDLEEETYAYSAGVGNYNIPGRKDNATYLVFYAPSNGVYKISLTSEDDGATVGFYGIPMFVQSTHRGDGEYDGRSFELIIHDKNTPYVIGVKSTKDITSNLVIERIGDAPFDPEYEPWEEVKANGEIADFAPTTGKTLTDFNISDSNITVTLGDDGYYYTSDGKLLYIRLGSLSNAKYLDVSLAFIAGFVDSNFGQNIGGYVYDENGEFVGKYSYNSMIGSYYAKCDANGVYPLTAELAAAIKVHGNSAGWWNPQSGNYLFSSVLLNEENAWLFLCCTAD